MLEYPMMEMPSLIGKEPTVHSRSLHKSFMCCPCRIDNQTGNIPREHIEHMGYRSGRYR
jgi:hypothetical protein